MTRRAALVAAALVGAACHRTTQVRPSDEQPQGRSGERGGGIPARPGRPPVPAAPQGLLEQGMVGRVQKALADRGLLKAHREGELDAPTTAAIRRFQREQGLAETGFPDRVTLKDLGIDPEHAYVHERDRKREEGQGRDGGDGQGAGARGEGR